MPDNRMDEDASIPTEEDSRVMTENGGTGGMGGSGGPGGSDGTGGSGGSGSTGGTGDITHGVQLNKNNTGVRGGVREGECAGSASSPYAGLNVINGTVTLDKDGEVYENFDVRGNILITANNVTLRCGRVSGNAGYTINSKAKNLHFEWIEAHQGDDGKTILGGNYTAYRIEVTGGEDGIHINAGTVKLTEVYVHDQNFIGAAHPDCIQLTSGGSVNNVEVIRSKLINFYKAPNAAYQINVADKWSIDDSYLWGGVYSILGDPGATGRVNGNYFGWDSTQFGAIGGVRTNRSNNVWWEWSDARCSGQRYSASSCNTPSDHPGNGTPID